MDYMKQINDLRQKKEGLVAKAEALLAENKAEEAKVINDEIRGVNNSISALQDLANESAKHAEPVGDSVPAGTVSVKENDKPFACLGEQLQAIRQAKNTGIVDDRLLKVNNATGASVGTGADGGFAVQQDFAGTILESAYKNSEILQRIDSYTVSADSNSAKWIQVDETDVSESVFGGVQMYWAAEAATVMQSKPKFKEMKLDLEKMMGIAYATDELLQDATFMTGFFSRAFALATDRLLSGAVISGDGNAKPLGIMNSKALVSVAKEESQGAGTIATENILAMWRRTHFNTRKNLVWLCHPDCETEFPELTLGPSKELIWMPEGGISGSMYQRILNTPIIYDDNCSALGEKGDIMLCDLKQYIMLRKGAIKQDWSMHVEFLTDQMAFRTVLRCNGAPKVNTPIKIKNSTNTRSPFVTLADRA